MLLAELKCLNTARQTVTLLGKKAEVSRMLWRLCGAGVGNKEASDHINRHQGGSGILYTGELYKLLLGVRLSVMTFIISMWKGGTEEIRHGLLSYVVL